MEVEFDVAGRATLVLRDDDRRVRRHVHSQLDPYRPAPRSEARPDVLLEVLDAPIEPPLVELQNPAGDDVVTASDGTSYYVLDGGRACSVPMPGAEGLARFTYERGFPIWRIFGPLVRPALQIAMLDRDAVAAHSASVEIDGAGVVIGGWSESGKTETALAFMETGARFVSDKWTAIGSDGTIAAFPISVGIRRWALRHLPRLRASLPAAARGQLLVAGVAAAVASPVRRAKPASRLGALATEGLQHALALADRASLSPSQLAAAYGQATDPPPRATLRTLALLTTVPEGDVEARPADAAWAARRLARSATFERRPYFELHERARFAFAELEAGAAETIERREERFLAETLEHVSVIEVRTPFPADPRRIADAISRWL
ncbi:MAG TPA: hypothetical protein VGQ84_03330 [Gaiellaceae bacterium]|nr:hypothetical protein [Gaiellaceae bacterium]